MKKFFCLSNQNSQVVKDQKECLTNINRTIKTITEEIKEYHL